MEEHFLSGIYLYELLNHSIKNYKTIIASNCFWYILRVVSSKSLD